MMFATSQIKMDPDPDNLIDLYVAAESGKAKKVKQLLEIYGSEFFKYQSVCDGNNALHIAFINKHDQVVNLLLEALCATSAYQNFTNHMGLTHLHIACTRKDEKLIQSILNTGASLESTVSPSSPLWAGYNAMHFAASYHSVQAMKVLLNAGMDHRSKTALGKTARDIVYEDLYDPLIIVDLLEEKEPEKHRREYSNFCVASLNENHTVVQGFIDHGATNINSRTNNECHTEPTPLHCAVNAESQEKVQILLQNGAKIDSYNNSTPLNLALNIFILIGEYMTDNVKKSHICQIIELLYAAVEDKMDSNEDANELSYFHAAIICNDLPTVDKYLNEGKANVNKSVLNQWYVNGIYPLHIALQFDSPEIAKLLVDYGANLIAYDTYYRTPLDMAFQLKCHKFIELLLMSNVKLNIATPLDQRAMFHLAMQLVHSQFDTTYGKILHNNRLTIGSIPVNIKDINVNTRDIEGNTALHYLYCNDSYAEVLLDLGADINAKNNEGKLPFVLVKNDGSLAFANRDVYPLFFHHVQKLKALGLEVDPENEKACKLIVEEKDNYSFIKQEMTRREQQRLEEIAKLKSTTIDDNTSLYDFIMLYPESTTVYAGCETLKNIAEGTKLKEEFPSYGYLIRLNYRAATAFSGDEIITRKSEPLES